MTDTAAGRVEAPAPARSFGWQALDSAREQRFTGALVVDVGEEIRLFFDVGVLYLAERALDPTLGERLLAVGVVTEDELAGGIVRIGEVAHFGRLFDRVPSIDRDTVVTAIEIMSDEVVSSMANREVCAAEALPYRHHPSGIQRWMLELPDDTIEPDPASAPPESVPAAQPVTAEPAVGQLPPPPPIAPPSLPEPGGHDAPEPMLPAPSLPEPIVGEVTHPASTESVEADITVVMGAPELDASSAAPIAEVIDLAPTFTPTPDVSETATAETDTAEPDALAVTSLADVIDLVPVVEHTPEPTSPTPNPPTGPAAAADAVISWDESGWSDTAEDVAEPVAPTAPLIAPLEIPKPAPEPPADVDPDPPRPTRMPNLPTGAERQARRALEISSDWTTSLGIDDDDAATAVIRDTPSNDSDDDASPPQPDSGHSTDPSDPSEAADSTEAPTTASERSDLSIQIVWPSGAIDPRSVDDAPTARSVDRPSAGGSARLAVGRSTASPATSAEPDPERRETDAADAAAFQIDWSLGATPPPDPAPPAEQAAAADVLDDVMHAVRRTVAACETRVARSQEAARVEQLGSLASLGGVMPTQPARSVFDDVMTPTFAAPQASGQSGEDRSGALRRLIGSLKRP